MSAICDHYDFYSMTPNRQYRVKLDGKHTTSEFYAAGRKCALEIGCTFEYRQGEKNRVFYIRFSRPYESLLR